jgi:MinD-like ATPase involved in chromosome partitioning or flagellar assembly
MTLVAFCCGKGSPGVSTIACLAGAVWPAGRRTVVAECDPSGNDLAARFGLSPRIGMTSLVLAHRRVEHSEESFDHHLQTLPGGLEILAGPLNPDAATSLDRELGAAGLAVFPKAIDLVVDCGRVLTSAPGQQEILNKADHVVVVTKPDAAGLAHTLWTLDVVRSLAQGTTSVVVVGSSQFSAGEIEQAFQAKMVGVLPFDEKSAATVCGSPGKTKRFARSSLVVSARSLVARVLDLSTLGDDTGVPTAGTHWTDHDGRSAVLRTGCGPMSTLELATFGEQDTDPS